MTQLKCSVKNCMYNDNDDQLCSKGDIMIGGQSATASNETRCESFQERRSSATNSVGSPRESIKVGCKAENCVFNEACKCSAQEIGIAGSNACNCTETECASFECKCK